MESGCVSEFPFHLGLPLIAAILFVIGLIFVKRASLDGVNPWTVTFLSNLWAALVFSSLWILGGPGQPWYMLWQPFIIATLYVMGLVGTFNAVEHGDVSIATPVFGVKVLFVAILATFFGGQTLPLLVWGAAALAVIGIITIQWTGGGQPKRIFYTIFFAIFAAMSFATFDVLVQNWAPAWGAGRFLPHVYWFVGLYSVVFLPFIQKEKLVRKEIRVSLYLGALLIACQAIFIVFTLSTFGDATRVNVMYATRGLWGVLFAWGVAKIWGGAEAHVPRRLMFIRLFGAVLLTLAVILAITAGK